MGNFLQAKQEVHHKSSCFMVTIWLCKISVLQQAQLRSYNKLHVNVISATRNVKNWNRPGLLID